MSEVCENKNTKKKKPNFIQKLFKQITAWIIGITILIFSYSAWVIIITFFVIGLIIFLIVALIQYKKKWE